MKPRTAQDIEQQFRELEARVNQTLTSQTQSQRPETGEFSTNPVISWFQHRSTSGKIMITAGGILLGLLALRIVMQLVWALISLVLLGLVLYGIYTLFLSSSKSADS